MPLDHFQRLLRCLELEAEAEATEIVKRSQRATGDAAERAGVCLIGLTIREEESGFGGRAVITLGKRDRRAELPWSKLNSGSPVVLSEEQLSESGAWRGVVTDRNRETITVVLAQSPEPTSDRPTFRLDLSSDEISRERQRAAVKKVAAADSGRLAALKRKLLGEESPEFTTGVGLITDERGSNRPLDESQRTSVEHALASKEVAVIHGPPGTGKTTAVVELIRQAVLRGERVLACAPSNLAVDNLLERLLATGERAIRIGHPARVLPELREHTLDLQVAAHPDLKLAREWTKQAWALRRQAGKFTRTAPERGARREQRDEAKRLLADARKMEERLVAHLLDSATVVCATLTGLDDELLGDLQFDLAVIDEAAQTTEPACWIPLLRAKRLVLAGDHCQLPPTILSSESQRLGFDLSLMQRLVEQWGDVISRQLTTQYRMHEQIMRFSSVEFYDSSLIAADSVREHLLADLSHIGTIPLTQTAMQFIDTAGSDCVEQAESEGSSRNNPGEADVVARQVQELLDAGVTPAEIAVITPYAAQARLLRTLIGNAAIEIDTVDGFQGREKEAVVISFVRSNATGEVGFLSDTRRTNVALTRARRKLIVIGDSSTLANHEFYRRLLDHFEREGAYGTVWDQPAM
ncbi:ATPase AAA [Planctomycetia bacterium]|nr:ATPase AAA [Planctomycetia bacterium]